MVYFKLKLGGAIVEYPSLDYVNTYASNLVLEQTTKSVYDQYVADKKLIDIIHNGEFNTALTTYFNSFYRRATNMPDTWYTHHDNVSWEDGTVRTRKQIQNSISALAVWTKYVLAYEGTTGFIQLPEATVETYLKDFFIIEKNYQTNKNTEYRMLTYILKIQELIEEKYKDQDAQILKLIMEMTNMRLEHHGQTPIDLTGAGIGQGI